MTTSQNAQAAKGKIALTLVALILLTGFVVFSIGALFYTVYLAPTPELDPMNYKYGNFEKTQPFIVTAITTAVLGVIMWYGWRYFFKLRRQVAHAERATRDRATMVTNAFAKAHQTEPVAQTAPVVDEFQQSRAVGWGHGAVTADALREKTAALLEREPTAIGERVAALAEGGAALAEGGVALAESSAAPLSERVAALRERAEMLAAAEAAAAPGAEATPEAPPSGPVVPLGLPPIPGPPVIAGPPEVPGPPVIAGPPVIVGPPALPGPPEVPGVPVTPGAPELADQPRYADRPAHLGLSGAITPPKRW